MQKNPQKPLLVPFKRQGKLAAKAHRVKKWKFWVKKSDPKNNKKRGLGDV